MRTLRSLGLGLFLTAATSGAADELNALSWLEGTWVRETSRSTRYESWKRLSDNTMEGDSWSISKADGKRRQVESLRLVSMGGEVFYIAKVPENPLPVPFKLTSGAESRLTFENPEHDFPTAIIYGRNGDGSMTVWAEGPGDGGEKQRLEFHFTRQE